MVNLYPMMFEPYYKEVIWGGRKLATVLGKALPNEKKIGESWEVYDSNKITNGPLVGWKLSKVLHTYGSLLVGSRTENLSKFPLLLKLSSAELDLSIQVHPNDAYAQFHETGKNISGKTEMIYVLSAINNARVFLGLSRPVNRIEMKKILMKPASILTVLQQMNVHDGDTIFVPPGTIHAYGGGITYFELQQNSDTTYRLFDWERRDEQGKTRNLHIEQALNVIDYKQINPQKNKPIKMVESFGERHLLALCSKFLVEKLVLSTSLADGCHGESFHILCVIDGSITLASENSKAIELGKGGVALIPASINTYTATPNTCCQLLRCYVPDLNELLTKLKSVGILEHEIVALGSVL